MSKNTGKEGFELGMELFGISCQQAEYLFDTSYYRKDHQGPISVAKRIEKFVAEDGKLPKNVA